MAFHISRSVGWGSNYTPDPSSPSTYKYFFDIDIDVDVADISGHKVTISVDGTYRVRNSATGGPPNRLGAASDFAVLAGGTWDKGTHAFDGGTNYYRASLPMMPNADSDLLNNKMVLEFRGDTYSSAGNHSTVWTKGGGVAPDYDGSTFDRTYPIHTTFTMDVPTSGDTPIITWTTSGWGPPSTYEWLTQETWASWLDLRWSAELFYNANGGAGAPPTQSYMVTGENYTFTVSTVKPTWEWHRFEGWSENPSATVPQYRGGDSVTVSIDSPSKTLYAVWTEWYRVGDVRYGGVFKTTHRSGGKCHLLQNGRWVEMRSIDAGTETNDPPSRRSNAKWLNQYKIGSN